MRFIERLALTLGLLWLIDRAWKMATIWHFFRQPQPTDPPTWPSVTMLHPVTLGATGLPNTLASGLQQTYPAPIQHLVICDAGAVDLQGLCRKTLREHNADGSIITTTSQLGIIATKIEKLLAALPEARNEVLCLIDDDVILPPDGLRQLVTSLSRSGVGAAFGLAHYVNYQAFGAGLMSAFVNINALPSYIPLTYLSEPYTITGHVFVLKREVFEAVGGLTGLETSVGDDHALAYRLRQAGLTCSQSQLIYQVDNWLPTLRDYRRQLWRWFALPRAAMLPMLSNRERFVTALGSISTVIPPTLLVLALSGRRRVLKTLGIVLASQSISVAWLDGAYLHPPKHQFVQRWLLGLIATLIAPFDIIAALIGNHEIAWRGQRLRLAARDFGRVEGIR